MSFSLEIVDSDLAMLESSEVPVLVDFWSPMCGACKMIAPALEDLAERWLGQVWIAKAQVDKNEAAVAEFGIEHLPTLVMLKGGVEVDRMEGGVRWEVLNQFIGRYAE
jgi:thioredoxin